MKNRFLICIALGVCSYVLRAQSLPVKKDIVSDLQRVNDYWIGSHPDPGDREWARAVYFTGNVDFYKLYPHRKYLDYSNQWAEKHGWALSGGTRTINADQQCAGQVYLELYDISEEPSEDQINYIRTNLENLIENDVTDAWWWIDALYMAMPSFTRLGVLEGNVDYFDQMYKLYTNTKVERGLYNAEEGLWYRDESFLPPYSTPNGEDSYWSRGNGWVFGAHVRVLQVLPMSDLHYDEYVSTFQSMAEALRVRQRSDGFWNVSLDDPEDFGGPETSGTAFFTYGMAWGLNNGFLDSATYYPVISKAWSALTTVAIHEDGYLGYIQGVGVAPSSSQPVTYESNSDFGVGSFLLAGSEVVKLASGALPEPPSFWLEETAVMDTNHLVIHFNKELDVASATNLNHYASDDLEIISVEVKDTNICVLEVSALEYGLYEISYQNIESEDGDTVSGTAKFAYNDLILMGYSSYEFNTSNVPENTLDLDFNTRWSAFGNYQWLLYDLGGIKVFDSLGIAFLSGDVRTAYFQVQTSVDMENFEIVFDGSSSGQTVFLENFAMEKKIARYVVFMGLGNSQSRWNSITEVRAFAHELSAPTDIFISNDTIRDAEVGAVVGDLSALDDDPGDVHVYALVEGEGDVDNELFEIIGDQLVIRQTIDLEKPATYSVRIEVGDLGENMVSKSFDIIVPVNIDPLSVKMRSSVQVFPVPVESGQMVAVKCAKCRDAVVEVVDMQGRICREKMIVGDGVIIDTSDFPAGVYLVRIKKAGKMLYSQQILIQ